MNVPASLQSPPPHDPARALDEIGSLVSGQRNILWSAVIIPLLVAALLGGTVLSRHGAVDMVTEFWCPMIALVLMISMPLALWALSNVRDIRRLFRDGVVVRGQLEGVSMSPSANVWATVRFELSPGVAFVMRTNVMDTIDHVRGVSELPVLIDPKSPEVAVLIAPSQKLSIGRAKRV